MSAALSPRSPKTFRKIYDRLYDCFGPQNWWPGDTVCEIVVGAVLTQNTNWQNVEKAIFHLRKNKLLSVKKLRALPASRLAALIKPSGYFNIKARRLKNLCDFVCAEYQGSLREMAKAPLETLRPQLLGINGIGPETADSILLYGFHKPVFVVDAYTKRFLRRHNLIRENEDYHAVQRLFESNLKKDARLFNEYHALIVILGKHFCRPSPKCESCPLRDVHYSLERRCRACFRSFLPEERPGRRTVCRAPACLAAR